MASSIQREFEGEPNLEELADLAELSLSERQIMTAYVVHGQSYKQIAATTGSSSHRIRNTIHGAAIKMRIARAQPR